MKHLNDEMPLGQALAVIALCTLLVSAIWFVIVWSATIH